MAARKILVVSRDDNLAEEVEQAVRQVGHGVLMAADEERALATLQQEPQDLIIVDLDAPCPDRLALVRSIRTHHPEMILLLAGSNSADAAVEALKLGAYLYVTKPVHPEELRQVIGCALEHHVLLEERKALRHILGQKYGFEGIIGRSSSLRFTLEAAARAAQTDSPVLIRGERGTGKELLAKAIHFNSSRRNKPFIILNCGAIPPGLFESELVGHLKGAFKGAVACKKGKVEQSDQGTLFLDEVSEVPLEIQSKLVRMIQHGEIKKIGATSCISVDVRVVASTCRNLQAMIEDGAFREDLYYRLAVVPLELPPLREREEDIPALTRYFFERSKQQHNRLDLVLRDSLLPHFCSYRWPGNIGELEDLIDRLVVLCPKRSIRLEDLPDYLRQPRVRDTLRLDLPSHGISLEAVERELILRALTKSKWNQTHAARYLNLSRKTLMYRMEKFGLRQERPGQAGEGCSS
ncbi:MAG: sigma-54 dependent transcriptional regulator [Bryobacteraceae bacterium]